MVVFHMALMCLYRVVPAAAGARLVVSDMWDILSPKKEPEMTMPAVSGAGMPMPVPIPIMARPMVPKVPQEVPMDRETTLHSSSPSGRKNLGVRYFRP